MSNTSKSRTTKKQEPATKKSASKKTAAKNASTKNSASKSSGSTSKGRKTANIQQEKTGSSKKSVVIIVSLIIALILELSNLNLLGQIGGFVQYAQFGLFGIMAYVFPVAGFVFVIYLLFRSKKSTKNVICFIVLFLCLCALTHLISGMSVEMEQLSAAWDKSAKELTGGGILGGAIAVILGSLAGRAGAYIIVILAVIVCVIFISEYPIAEKIGNGIRKRREERYYLEADYDDYEDEYDEYDSGYDEEEEYARQRRKRKKEYDSRAEAVYDDEPVYAQPRRTETAARTNKASSFRDSFAREKAEDIPENNRRAKVYEGTDKDGNYIKIVHVPSKKKSESRDRASLNRLNNKSQTVRTTAAPARLKRSDNKTKGLGEGLEMFALDANGDEMHEITDHNAKNRRYAVDEAETKAVVNEPDEDLTDASWPADETPAVETEPVKETKVQENKIRQSSAGKTFSSGISEAATVNKTGQPASSGNTSASLGGTKAVPVRKRSKTAVDTYKYPPLDLLEKKKRKGGSGNDDLNKVSRNLELILSTYGVNAKVIDAQEGPSVTRYELQPELGTRVSRITSLADDLKLNLAVPDIRIEAPIPGRAAVGIEIPNKTKDTVLMRELLEEPTLISHPSKIAYAAGKDISGNVVVSDIAQMPHLLVAGTTGSGKSIFVNTILMTILYRAKPSEVGLIIIDPKQVEFGVYSGIPHLVQDVVTDPAQAVSTLRWAVVEMTNRYQRMQLSGVRDFKGYNQKFDKGQLNPEEENPKRMPQIVIVIDELADLMMVASKETESLICRLAQLARAAGIHLIIATQRPSVDVVTGLIKANIPARVALLVASGTDSRTIIDSNGAEKLLGKGDMLFYPTGYVKPVRVQGAFVSEKEVYDTIQYIKENNESGYYADEAEEIENYTNAPAGSSHGIPGLTSDESSGSDSKYDEYFYEAGKLCIDTGKASSSMIQRRFSIGFNRAARIIDQLEEVGAVGPQNGAKPREILVDEAQFEELFASLNK